MSNDKPTHNSSPPAELLQLVQQLKMQQEALREQLRQEQSALHTLARRLWLQQEHERAVLSRELHDGVGQLLTGLKTQLGQMKATSPNLEAIYQTASTAVESIRSLSRLMHPTILSDLGLAAAISWLNRQLLQPTGVEFHSQLDIPDQLDTDLQIFLFRLIQEAMVNTVKHAHAQQFSIYLQSASDSIRLDMIDDGRGFSSATHARGIGLQSMYDRCEAFGAGLSINSSAGNGCQISISLPHYMALL